MNSKQHFQSLCPIDDSVVWSGAESTEQEVLQVMKASAEAGNSWRQTAIEDRMELVRRYSQYVADHRQEIADLITREVGKLPWDSAGEVNAAIAKAEVSIKAYQERRADSVLDDGPPKRTVRYQPLGVTFVLGPFNFPLHLPGGQIIPALLMGNSVVMKPSEHATAVGDWMLRAWQAVGLPENVLQLIYGRVSPAVTAIDSPHVGGVFLTGGRLAGQAIHRQLAGRYEVQLALELGGNNPVVITNDLPADDVAAVISFSAFISAGQRCTCARRAIFVDGGNADACIAATISRSTALKVGLPGDEDLAQIGPLVSAESANGLKATYESLLSLGCKPLVPFRQDNRRPNLVHPTIVDASGLSDQQLVELGEMEWFGPLLVIQKANSIDDAIKAAKQTCYGLSAALLGGDQALFDRFVNEVGAGIVNWNRATTGAAGVLPFGGLGSSGNHQPAGFFAIDFCGDPVASLEDTTLASNDPWSVVK